jgi:hypothetical protein
MKTFADMNHSERIAALMRDVRSPKGGATALALIEHVKQELKEIEDCYQIHLMVTGQITPEKEKPSEPAKEKSKRAPVTVAEVVGLYKTHPLSTYPKLPARTQDSYDSHMRRVAETLGEHRIAQIKETDILWSFQEWAGGADGDKFSMAHAVARHLRMMMNFVASTTDDADCHRLANMLRRIKLPTRPMGTDRQPINAKQVDDFIREAHVCGVHSMALAQALQFEGGVSQLDVRGEWVPGNEPGTSDIVHVAKHGPIKWVRGLKWSQIEGDTLRYTPTDHRLSDRSEVRINLKDKPLIWSELTRLKPRPTSGPMIVCEATDRPWTANEFRKAWRKIADRAGIPKNVTNGARSDDDDEDAQRAAEVGSAAR